MVSNTRGTPDTRRVRRLKLPAGLEAEADPDGTPLRLRIGGAWQTVTLSRRPWRVDQHWWRSATVSRIYYEVALENGPPLTVYRDLLTGTWFRQEYM